MAVVCYSINSKMRFEPSCQLCDVPRRGRRSAGNLTSDGLRTTDYDSANRSSKVRIIRSGEAASIRLLHNALGQRVFKGEVTAEQTLPNETALGTGFVAWLKSNFQWLFAQAQANTSIGTAFSYDEAGNLLGEYDNGSASGSGRTEYIWLPTEDGSAVPIGIYRNGRLFAVHADHINTPRLMTNDSNQPVWQWSYSAFGNNKLTGVLKATPNPRQAITNQPVLLKATAATELNLRFPGQYFDSETNLSYNWNRYYQAGQGRYSQSDPIGLDGGWNRFGYVDADALNDFDPDGFAKKKPSVSRLQVAPAPTGGSRSASDGKVSPIPFPAPFSRPQAIGKFCESPSQSDVWKDLQPYRDGIKTNGETGRDRRYFTWDYTHGDVEVFDRNGNHMGSMNPNSGAMHKPAVSGRTLPR